MPAAHSSRHGSRKSVRKPLAILTAVLAVGVAAVAIGVASASTPQCTATADQTTVDLTEGGADDDVEITMSSGCEVTGVSARLAEGEESGKVTALTQTRHTDPLWAGVEFGPVDDADKDDEQLDFVVTVRGSGFNVTVDVTVNVNDDDQ